MPYIKIERAKFLDENPEFPKTYGELNYVFTRYFIKVWNRNPKYDTIHLLRKISYHPQFDTELSLLEQTIKKNTLFSSSDTQAAFELAFQEFYRRVASHYEARKANENGDVYRGVKDISIYASKVFQEEGDR